MVSPVFLPENPHGQRSLAGYSLWGHKESDTIERLSTQHILLNVAIQVEVEFYFIVVLIFIFLMTNEVEYFFCACMSFMFFFVKYLLKS